MKNTIEKILSDIPIITNMVTTDQVRLILNNLIEVIEAGIQGDVVELGCNEGTTSLILQHFLKENNVSKSLHLYDSFEGLPDQVSKDENTEFKKGDCKTYLEKLILNFERFKLELPFIIKSWFRDIEEKQLPEKICFAFFDGDFYTSIYDSFEKIYPRLETDGIICVHDFGWYKLPGVMNAVNDFLRDKKYRLTSDFNVGIIQKLD